MLSLVLPWMRCSEDFDVARFDLRLVERCAVRSVVRCAERSVLRCSVRSVVRCAARAEVRVAGSRPAERVALTVADPADRILFESTAILCWTHCLTPVAEADGLWKVKFAAPSTGAFDDFSIAVAGVRPFLFFSPDKFWHSPKLRK
jgi:hypothetical protein